MKSQNEQSTRRKWFEHCARFGVLTGIAVVWVRVSKQKPGIAEQPCIDVKGKTGCKSCGLFSDCILPRAQSVKQFLQGRRDEKSNS